MMMDPAPLYSSCAIGRLVGAARSKSLQARRADVCLNPAQPTPDEALDGAAWGLVILFRAFDHLEAAAERLDQ